MMDKAQLKKQDRLQVQLELDFSLTPDINNVATVSTNTNVVDFQSMSVFLKNRKNTISKVDDQDISSKLDLLLARYM